MKLLVIRLQLLDLTLQVGAGLLQSQHSVNGYRGGYNSIQSGENIQ